MSLAHPVSEENAFKDVRGLLRGGKRLLVSAGLIALAFFFALILILTYSNARDQNLIYIVGDYVVTLGIAVPGLILFILREYTNRSIRKGNAKAFSTRVKLGLVSISWIVLAVVLVIVVTQAGV